VPTHDGIADCAKNNVKKLAPVIAGNCPLSKNNEPLIGTNAD